MTRQDFQRIAEIIGKQSANAPGTVSKHHLAFVMQLLTQTSAKFNAKRFLDSITLAERAAAAQKAAQEAAESERQAETA